MLFLFFFLVRFNNFLVIPVVREKIKVKPALAISTGAPTILVKEQIDTSPVVALKKLKCCLCNQIATYLLNFLLHDFI